MPTRLMASERRGDRERGKSDPIDALAVARAALRQPDLPVAKLDGPARSLKLLVDHREDLVRERTRMQARPRWHLHELFPGLIPPRSLRRENLFKELEERLEGVEGTVARIARELVEIRDLTKRANDLEREITKLIRGVAPSLPGAPGMWSALGGQDRRRSGRSVEVQVEGGLRPLEPDGAHSGLERQHELPLNRGGNRQVNAALHRIALTQTRGIGTGRAYVDGRIARGDPKKEAVRLLRRRLSDEVYRRLLLDDAPAMKDQRGAA